MRLIGLAIEGQAAATARGDQTLHRHRRSKAEMIPDTLDPRGPKAK
jgi:hypothetical protein